MSTRSTTTASTATKLEMYLADAELPGNKGRGAAFVQQSNRSPDAYLWLFSAPKDMHKCTASELAQCVRPVGTFTKAADWLVPGTAALLCGRFGLQGNPDSRDQKRGLESLERLIRECKVEPTIAALLACGDPALVVPLFARHRIDTSLRAGDACVKAYCTAFWLLFEMSRERNLFHEFAARCPQEYATVELYEQCFRTGAYLVSLRFAAPFVDILAG